MSKRRPITIELTKRDEEHIARIQDATGESTIVGAIRHALRETVRGLSPPPVSLSAERLKALDELVSHAQKIGMGYE